MMSGSPVTETDVIIIGGGATGAWRYHLINRNHLNSRSL